LLTRIHVQGFKNLLDVDVRFGPFTCIAGDNGAGKSNLFDAIRFLSLLTRYPIMEAAKLLRETKGRSPEVSSLFTTFQGFRATCPGSAET
jgi:AAA15 family ATPase/GTPase